MNKLIASRMAIFEEKHLEKRVTLVKTVSKSEKSLIVSSFSLPSDFFAEKALVALCMLESNNKIKTTALLNTGATGYSFIDLSMIRHVSNKLQIEPIRLSKPKAI